MPRYEVTGAYTDSGEDATIVVEALTPESAEKLAQERWHMMVSGSHLAPAEPSTPPATPAALAPEYGVIEFMAGASIVVGVIAGFFAVLALLGYADKQDPQKLAIFAALILPAVGCILAGFLCWMLREQAINTWHIRAALERRP